MTKVRFIPQAWIRDYAVEVDPEGPTVFDVPDQDAQDAEGHWLPDRSYESDTLKAHPHAPQWVREWRGPCDIEILHDEAPPTSTPIA